MISSVSEASLISCNATAVDLMEKGRHEEAYNLLKSSISRLRAEFSSSRRSSPGISSFYKALSEEQRPSVVDATTSSLYSVPIHTGRTKADYLQNQQNIFSFYTRAFEIRADGGKGVSLHSIFIVLAYNMGLALFIGSTLTGPQLEPHRVLHNIRVFDAAMRAIRDSFDSPDLHSVLLALTFNLGYLHHLSYNFSETRDHLSLAVSLVKCPTTEETLSDEDYGFFYANMCMFADRGMELHQAPAA